MIKRNRTLLITVLVGFMLLLGAAVVWLNWFSVYDAVQTYFDQPEINQTLYQTFDDRQAVHYSEISNRYEIVLEYPVIQQDYVSRAITDYIQSRKNGFLSLVKGPDRQKQPKNIKPSLRITFESHQVGSYSSFYFTGAQESGGEKSYFSRAFICQDGQDVLLKPSDIFAENSGFIRKLARQMAAAWDKVAQKPENCNIAEIVEQAEKDPGFFEDRLILTETGVCVSLDGSLTGGDNILLNEGYTPFADSFKIALPEGLLPVTEKPSRVINVKKDKVVALTFDDGPSQYTSKVLEYLKQYNAKATFFVVGYNVNKRPNILKQIVAQGSEIGDHTQSHANLTKLTLQDALLNVTTVLDSVEDITGKRPVLLRPPGGNITDELAQEIGMPVILWDVDPQDWKLKDSQKVANHIISHVRSGDIVLLHDLYPSTVDALPIVLKTLSDQGYEFVTVSELLNGRGEFAGKIIRNRRITADETAQGH